MNNERHFSPTLKQLRAFVAVYQLRKLSAAATQLFLTQSAVSVLIRQMEDGLGTRLFDRTTRSLQPTPAAHEAVQVAERILRDLDSLGAGLRDLTGLRRGRVTVAVTPTLAEILLPPVVRVFREQHPDIHLVIDDCAPDQFFSRVINEQTDFGIGTPEGAAPGIELQTLLRDHLSLVCPRNHPLAQRRSVRWRDLEGLPVTTVRPGLRHPAVDRAVGRTRRRAAQRHARGDLPGHRAMDERQRPGAVHHARGLPQLCAQPRSGGQDADRPQGLARHLPGLQAGPLALAGGAAVHRRTAADAGRRLSLPCAGQRRR